MHVRTGLHGRRHLVQDGLLRHLDRRELLIEGLWWIVIACGFRRPPKLPNLIGVAQAIDQQALRLQDPFDREVFLSVDPAATAKSLVVARQDPDQILSSRLEVGLRELLELLIRPKREFLPCGRMRAPNARRRLGCHEHWMPSVGARGARGESLLS